MCIRDSFKTKMTLGFDSGSYALQPAADGQYCDSTDNGSIGNEPMPLGGRQWLWGSSPAPNDCLLYTSRCV